MKTKNETLAQKAQTSAFLVSMYREFERQQAMLTPFRPESNADRDLRQKLKKRLGFDDDSQHSTD